MHSRRPLSRRTVEKLRQREASIGLEGDDAAARWLAEHDKPPPPAAPKSLSKNKTLHQWRRRQPRS
jgi:hypothetical protein